MLLRVRTNGDQTAAAMVIKGEPIIKVESSGWSHVYYNPLMTTEEVIEFLEQWDFKHESLKDGGFTHV